MRKSSTTETKNEGEGNRSADQRYRKAATQYAASGVVKTAARKAERALDSSESAELKKAEAAGKARGKVGSKKRH